MNKILKYIGVLSLLLFVGTSCSDPDNWTIVTETPEGAYVIGDATVYQAAATASYFSPAAIDPRDGEEVEDFNVTSVYTWLKANEEFFIFQVDSEGNEKTFGEGDLIESSYDTYSLAVDAKGFTVESEGLYLLVLNNEDSQLSVVPAKFGIIGDATAEGWDKETIMDVALEGTTVKFSLKDENLNNKGLKFRFIDWGIELPYGSGTVKLHSNQGFSGDDETEISDAAKECKSGGQNFQVSKVGLFDIILSLDLRSKVWKASAKLTKEDTSKVPLPEKMYLVGTVNDWAVDKGLDMIPINPSEGKMFWKIIYLKTSDEFKFNADLDWKGNDFGMEGEEPLEAGKHSAGKNNIKVAKDGFYTLRVIITHSTSGQLVKEFEISEPELYIIGETAAEGWDGQLAEADKFTLEGEEFVSPLFNNTNKEGNPKLRMCHPFDGVEWWQSEFNILDGNIVYRGTGDELGDVEVKKGQKVRLNFNDNTGVIE